MRSQSFDFHSVERGQAFLDERIKKYRVGTSDVTEAELAPKALV
jgi:hypothetical protein